MGFFVCFPLAGEGTWATDTPAINLGCSKCNPSDRSTFLQNRTITVTSLLSEGHALQLVLLARLCNASATPTFCTCTEIQCAEI